MSGVAPTHFSDLRIDSMSVRYLGSQIDWYISQSDSNMFAVV